MIPETVRRDLPSGTVTFLFTDVEGSTKLLHELGAEAYAEELAEHRTVVREACTARGGVEVDTQGDAFFVAFPTAPGALEAAEAITEGLASGPIALRIGVHTGTPLLTDEGYVGEDVHLAARVAACAHGGQVVLSATTRTTLLDERYSLVELGEHRLKDIASPVSLFQLGSKSFPPLKTISNTNLPRPASSFVGRESELEQVLARIEAGARLVTLTGPGGSGKTRLALEAAATLVPDYKAGVFWVGFASLRDPSLVTATIAHLLGAKDGLAEHIGEREMLILVDNVEQVIAAAPELSSLTQSCPNLTLLVTSRELLRLQGEVEYPVPPLADTEAVSLFCERAQTGVSEEIAELCRRLDNLPLAVELAAARAKAVSPAQILERISQRLDLLKGGRDADPRQQTLRTTIDWSYDLLSEDEKQLFRRLSVFSGGCTLEATDAVCEADLYTLQSLVEKSLLRYSSERYWMLETIRQLALERLDESVEADAVRAMHAHHFLAMAQSTDSVDRLEAEHNNVRAAFRRLSTEDDRGRCAQLAIALMPLWRSHGPISEGRAWFAFALANPGQLEDAVRSSASANAAWLAIFDADLDAAEQLLEESLRSENTRDDAELPASWFDASAHIAADRGDYARARQFWERTLEVKRAAGDRVGVARTLNNLGHIAFFVGDTRGAADLMDKALSLVRETSDKASTAQILESRAEVALAQGVPSLARHCLVECYHLLQEVGERFRTCEVLWGLAEVAATEGNVLEAARLLGAEETLRQEVARVLRRAERERLERVVRLSHADAEADAFDAAWINGAAIGVDALVQGQLSVAD
jgi:predicted ATPase/class 3 adenylate cyclase